jgi:PAS domain S-box-containing protein
VFELYSGYEAITDACRQALAGNSVKRTVKFEGVVFDVWYQPTYDETGSVDGVLGVAVTVTDRAHLEDELRANDRALRELHTRASRSDITLEERIRTLLEIGRDRLDLSYGFLTRIEDGTQHIVEAVGRHEDLQAGASAPLSEAYCRRTIEAAGLLGVRNAPAEGWEGDPAYERFQLNCYIGGKVLVNGELYGTVCFADSEARDRTFTEFEESLVELLVQWFAYELERDQREERLHEINDELETVLDTSPVAIIELAADGTVRQWNQAAAEMFQLSATEAIGSDIRIVPEERRPEFQSLLSRVMNGETIREYETTRQRSNGSQRVVSLNVEPTVNADGDPTGAIAAVTDITNRKRRQRRTDALRAATQDLVEADDEQTVGEIALQTAREALGFPVCAMWLYDETDDVLRPVAESDEAVELVGQAPTVERGEGLFWRAFLTGETVSATDLRSERALFNPETEFESEIIVPIADHGVLAVSAPATNAFEQEDINVLETLAGSLTAALNSVVDKQRLRTRDRELQRQNAQLEEFADVIAHDIRGPLTAARGFFELAMETQDLAHFQQVEEAHARMERLIDDLLTMARHGRSIDEREPVDLAALAKRIWPDVHDEATLELREPLPELTADIQRLEEVFSNLFRNAVDHAGAGVTVRVGPLDDGGFYIEDDGPGVPIEKHKHIFDYGYTTKSRGTGIGLAIVREIVAAHGWHISIAEGSDGGARFEIAIEQESEVRNQTVSSGS